MIERTQTLSIDELRGILRVAEDHKATEVTITDWRPDAECVVLELHPGNLIASVDDAGCEIDVMVDLESAA